MASPINRSVTYIHIIDPTDKRSAMLFWFKLRLSGSRNAAEGKGVSLAYDIGCVLQPDKQAKRSDKNVWQLCKCAAPCWLSIMIYKSNVRTDTNVVVSKPELLVGMDKN